MIKTYVYFVQAAKTELIKIGRAADVQRRMRNLQQGSPDILTLLGVVSEAIRTEGSIHAEFATERTHSEWFKPSSRLLSFIQQHAAIPVIEVSSPDIFPNGTRLRTPGNIGNLVQAYRLKAKLTQQDLAELVKVSRQWIVAVEKGKARAEIGLVLQVLNTLDIPIWAK